MSHLAYHVRTRRSKFMPGFVTWSRVHERIKRHRLFKHHMIPNSVLHSKTVPAGQSEYSESDHEAHLQSCKVKQAYKNCGYDKVRHLQAHVKIYAKAVLRMCKFCGRGFRKLSRRLQIAWSVLTLTVTRTYWWCTLIGMEIRYLVTAD